MSCSTSVLEFLALKRTRRYGAKVKTGCRTCKIRRVKCDEKKPACTRCVSTGRICDGYAQDLGAQQVLVPNRFPGMSSPLSGLGDNVLYLEFYHRCASRALASNFDSEFWSRIVLQMAQLEPSVRHATIALGYLIKTEPGDAKWAHSAPVIDNRKTLLRHYNKAVRLLVDRMAEPSYSVEIGLVTCLIFVCIEFVRCDFRAAFSHLISGLKIITEWRYRAQLTLQNGALDPQPLKTKHATAGDEMINGKLVPMFTRAITGGLIYGAPFEPILDNYCMPPQINQERAFSSILEAQLATYDIRNAALLMISVIMRKLRVGIQPSPQDWRKHAHLLKCHESWFQELQRLEREEKLSEKETILASSLKVLYYTVYVALACAADVDQMSYDAYLSSFQAMNYHARVVIDSMDSSDSPLPSSSTSSSTSPLASGSSDTSASPPGSSSGDKKAGAHFTFEISLIPTLYHAALHCRCPATRRETVALLERNPPREALWDAKQHAMVARRAIEIEEKELDPKTGWPAQKVRLAYALISPNMDANGGFRVGFATAAWLENDMEKLVANRRRQEMETGIPIKEGDIEDPVGPRGLKASEMVDMEWDEWFVM